jgi:hypothetical protein
MPAISMSAVGGDNQTEQHDVQSVKNGLFQPLFAKFCCGAPAKDVGGAALSSRLSTRFVGSFAHEPSRIR